MTFREVNNGWQYPSGPVVNSAPERVYIAGPISGDLVGNMPAFYEIEAELLAQGNVTFNPGRLDGGETARESVDLALVNAPHRSHQWYMRRCVVGLAMCSTIVMLPGWEDSKGARAELALAQALGMPVTYLIGDYSFV